VSWVAAPYDWLISCKCLKEMHHFHLQVYESVHRLITLKIKAIYSFKMSRRDYPTTWHNNPEDLIPE